MAKRLIFVMPEDTGKPIIDAIYGAKKSLRIKMFIFTDPDLIKAVKAAKKRGVKIDIMLNPSRRSGKDENNESREMLTAGGINVKDTNPDFVITHEKSMVIDDENAFVQSLNWETKNFNESRDYALFTTHKHEVDEIIAGFETDLNREHYNPGKDAHLIWCRGNGRERIDRLIDGAKHALFVQNERYQDANSI